MRRLLFAVSVLFLFSSPVLAESAKDEALRELYALRRMITPENFDELHRNPKGEIAQEYREHIQQAKVLIAEMMEDLNRGQQKCLDDVLGGATDDLLRAPKGDRIHLAKTAIDILIDEVKRPCTAKKEAIFFIIELILRFLFG